MGLWQQFWDVEHCNLDLYQALRERLTTSEEKAVDGGKRVHGGGDWGECPERSHQEKAFIAQALACMWSAPSRMLQAHTK